MIDAVKDPGDEPAIGVESHVEQALDDGLRDVLGRPSPSDRQDVLRVLGERPSTSPFLTTTRLAGAAARSSQASSIHRALAADSDYDADKRFHDLREAVLALDAD